MMVAKMRHIWKFGIPAKKQTKNKTLDFNFLIWNTLPSENLQGKENNHQKTVVEVKEE